MSPFNISSLILFSFPSALLQFFNNEVFKNDKNALANIFSKLFKLKSNRNTNNQILISHFFYWLSRKIPRTQTCRIPYVDFTDVEKDGWEEDEEDEEGEEDEEEEEEEDGEENE